MATPTIYYLVIKVSYSANRIATIRMLGLYESISLIEKDHRVQFSRMERYRELSIRQQELKEQNKSHYWIRETTLITK